MISKILYSENRKSLQIWNLGKNHKIPIGICGLIKFYVFWIPIVYKAWCVDIKRGALVIGSSLIWNIFGFICLTDIEVLFLFKFNKT